MDKIASTMKTCVALLILLNLGMVGLYVVVLRLDARIQSGVTLRQDPLVAEWRDASGTSHALTTFLLPGDTAAVQSERHRLRLVAAQNAFPEARVLK